MKLITLGVAAALAAGSIGLACAGPTNLITNGDFSSTTLAAGSGPWQFGTLGNSGSFHGGGSCTYGQIINDWSGNGGYEIWYSSASAASSTEPCSYYGGDEEQLLSPVTAPPAGPGTFVGLDGITSPIPHASISQTVGGLVAGKQYKVGFYWGNTQLQNRTGTTTEQLQVSLGSQSFSTPISTVLTHAWSGWFYQTFTFTAGSSAGSDLLSFLSIGTPNSLPPFALLAGVTMYAVPEPPVLAMFGGGLLGLGLLTLYTRRRKERREAEA